MVNFSILSLAWISDDYFKSFLFPSWALFLKGWLALLIQDWNLISRFFILPSCVLLRVTFCVIITVFRRKGSTVLSKPEIHKGLNQPIWVSGKLELHVLRQENLAIKFGLIRVKLLTSFHPRRPRGSLIVGMFVVKLYIYHEHSIVPTIKLPLGLRGWPESQPSFQVLSRDG